MTVAAEAAPVTMTDRAARRIASILAKEPAGSVIRLAVNGGGCSGFQYEFAIAAARSADDLVVERGGVAVVIDPVSLDLLRGSEIDFSSELIGAMFKVVNPNATASCGCGTSFGV
ncbi:MAG: iron-sulfur cluster assembly accessory protein [Parvularculaceae bacterium]|nr:iron-sulfur cluster assembly accessory protein [Parvularculaceae bacterium]